VNIEQIIAAEGTPALIIDRKAIQQKYEQFCRELRGIKICYALKANPHPGIIELLQKFGCDLEISSQGELELLLQLGVLPQNIISSNPVKDQAFIGSAYATGINLFAFDSYAEIEKLARFAPGSKVYVRLSVSNEGSEWPLSRKFGVEIGLAVELLVQAPAALPSMLAPSVLGQQPGWKQLRRASRFGIRQEAGA
jgi:ornithine decarboxylase